MNGRIKGSSLAERVAATELCSPDTIPASGSNKRKKGRHKITGTPSSSPGPNYLSSGGKSCKQDTSRRFTSCRTRVTGADLYVVRLTRSGRLGNAMPCWRCLEWCKWAGIKRIFHYSGEDGAPILGGLARKENKTKPEAKLRNGRWICVKVNEARMEDCYWTHADGRILSGTEK